MIEKIKQWSGIVFAGVAGLLYIFLRRQKDKTGEVETALARSKFTNVTQENDKAYENSKKSADDLVNEYRKSRADTDHT